MNQDDVCARIFAIVAKTFGVDAAAVDVATTADDVDGWDSLAHATLLIRIEKHFNIDLGPDGSGAQDLGALIALVRRRRDDGARESRAGS